MLANGWEAETDYFRTWISSAHSLLLSPRASSPLLGDISVYVRVYLVSLLLCTWASVRIVHQGCVVLASVLRQTTAFLVALWLWYVLHLWLVVVGSEALALAGRHNTDFVSPSVAVGTLQLNSPCPGVGRDAAVVRGTAPPPLTAHDRVWQEMRWHALAGAHKLLDRFGTATRSVCDVTSGT